MTARTIEAKLLITGQDRGASAAINQVAKATAGLEKAAKASAEVTKLTEQLGRLEAQTRTIEGVRRTAAAVAAAEMAMKMASGRARELATALDAAKKAGKGAEEIKGLTAQHQAAERAVRATTSALAREEQAARAARAAVRDLGVPFETLTKHQDALGRAIDATTGKMQRQMAVERQAADAARRAAAVREAAEARAAATRARAEVRREAVGTVLAGAGVIAAHKGKQIGIEAIDKAASLDYAKRYQVVAGGISEDAQKRRLLPQAFRIGQETKFTNEDIVEAQTATLQGLPMQGDLKAGVAAAIVESVKDYAVMMRAGMATSAEGLRSFLSTSQKDISTEEKAVFEAKRASNLLVKMAKMGGMKDEDVQDYIRFGVPTGNSAGLSDTTMMALGASAKRSGLGGSEAGVFMRAAASKLIAPTAKGLDALTAAGIDYNKFTTMPGGLSVGNLEAFSKRRFGKGFSDDQRGRLGDLLQDGDVVGNREEFTKRVSEIVEEGFAKNRQGKTKAQDARNIAKMLGDFHKLSVESVNTEGLLDAILSNPKMTQALLNAFFTDKHGGKASVLAGQFEQFGKDRKELRELQDKDPDFAQKAASYMSAGFGGAIDNLKGSIETAITKAGEASAGPVTAIAQGISKITDGFSSLTESQQQIAIALGGSAAVAGGVVGAGKIAGKLMGIGGLTTAAVALDGSAAALTAAAIKLGADPKDIASQAKNLAPAGGALVAGAVAGGVAVGGTAASVVATEAVKNKDFREPYLDGGMLGADPGGYGIGGAIVAAPELAQRMSEQNKREAEERGKQAGEAAGKGVADGIKAKEETVLEQGRSLYERLKEIFRDGIKIPVKVDGDGLSGSAGSDGLKGGMGSDDLGAGTSAGTGAGRGGMRRLGSGGSGVAVPRGASGPGTGAGGSWYEAVMRAEGTAGKDPYNVVLGNGRYGLPEKPLTDMTLAEAYRFGRTVRARHGASSAIGAFQIVGRTMREHMKHTGLGWGDKFSPENQRKLAASIRKREGWGAWEGFKVHPGELRRAREGGWEVPDRAMPPTAKPTEALERQMPQGESSAERMERAADRMAALSLSTRHTVEVLAGPGVRARTKGMTATGSPGVKPSVGVSMPGAEMMNVG